jgi:mannose-1-phosphate guanylyltransferase / phosphomannomutase
MKAVIMAGGFGTRLRPLTCNIPKPMVPMLNKPMMEHIVELLKKHEITDMISTLYYQPDVIANHFDDGHRFGISMQYLKAEADFGTAGSVRNARPFLDQRFIIISGDVFTDFDLTAAIRFHEEKKAKATIVLTHASNPLQYGVVLTHDDGKISRFLEKPTWGEVFSDTINTGIYILEPEILDLIPPKEEFDFSKNLFPILLEQDMGLYGYVAEGYWRDVGSLNEYQDAHSDALRGLVKANIPGVKQANLYVGTNSQIDADPKNFSGLVVIGKNTRIHSDVTLANAVIGDNCDIQQGSVIKNSVIWSGTKIGTNVEMSADVIGTDCTIGDDVVISENVFMSDQCIIGKRSRLSANIKLWPEKVVEEGSVVTRSLVWEDRWLRELFREARVSGISNVEMNPEFAAKLGAAFGALVGSGSTVVTSRDSDNVSRMINRAFMTGLMSAGVHCADLRASSIPIVRHELRSGTERGGIHVRKSPHEKNLTDIIFFDADGKDLPSGKAKSVERLFFGEDFARSSYDSVGQIRFPERSTESYIERGYAALNVQAIRSGGLKLVIDYSNGIASTIFPNILGNLNVQTVSLNAYLDSQKLTRSKELGEQSMKELAHVVTSLQYDVGCILDPGAEKMTVIDERGKAIDSDRLLTLMTKLVVLAHPDIKKIAVPVSASAEIDLLAEEFGLTIVKTRDSHLALMEAASNKQIRFVGGTKGGFIFNEFLFASDGMYSVSKLLECLALTKKRLGELDRETPRLHLVKRAVACSWNLKGQVMRHLMKDTERLPRELVDGVKVFPHSKDRLTSVLLNPDRTRPVFHINAESADPNLALQLANEFEAKLHVWMNT